MSFKKFFSIKFIAIILAAAFVISIIAINNKPSQSGRNTADSQTVTVYKSPTCGCCGQYIAYLRKNGYQVDVKNTSSMDEIKQQYGIPSEIQSCHTTIINDKVIEGHIPVEIIAEFMSKDSSLFGIALPGMPSGSPGMPGPKQEKWSIKGFTEQGDISEFSVF